jgi:hypothetical protein
MLKVCIEYKLRKEIFLKLSLNFIPFTLNPFNYTINFFPWEKQFFILRFENWLGVLNLRRKLAEETKEKHLKIYKRSNFRNQQAETLKDALQDRIKRIFYNIANYLFHFLSITLHACIQNFCLNPDLRILLICEEQAGRKQRR